MSESFTIANPSAATCPEWCEAIHPQYEMLTEHLHYGPTFGLIRPDLLASDGQGITAHVEEESEATVADLRQLIVDATAAIEWIEAHQ